METEKGEPRSLRGKMLIFMLICWLLFVLLVLGSMSYYVFSSYNSRLESEIADRLEMGMQFAEDRLDNAVAKIRRTAYDDTVRNSWIMWNEDEFGWISLYSRTMRYLNGQYLSDERFPIVAFWFSDDPEYMRAGLYVEPAGGSFRQLSQFWSEDFEGVTKRAEGLDTYVGVYVNDGRVYLVRNLTNRFEAIGTQANAIDTDFFFSGLHQMPWVESLCIWLNDSQIVLSGEAPDAEVIGLVTNERAASQIKTGDGSRYSYNYTEGDGYTLSVLIKIDRGILLEELAGYQTILIVMTLLLWPMLVLYYKLYENNITEPLRKLMSGLRQIESGYFGIQVEAEPKSREFQYIIDSFNRMSSQLRSQFEQIYREELSLRDARIKALQSQINPHFLNNTLEIINWEARMSGNAKVSRMIESLSTLLDAAMDRDSRQEVRFSEELNYINAYFYIADQRFGKRLTITKEIAPETLEFLVPRLILQPIVENAVEHGIAPGGHGRVVLRSSLEGERLIVEVENDGNLSEEDRNRIELMLSPDYDVAKEGSYGLGIANVSQRLRIICGGESGLSILQKDSGAVLARMIIEKSYRLDREDLGHV